MDEKAIVVLYTKQADWPDCARAKSFLARHNVDYLEKDVIENREYMRELVSQFRVMSVPVLVVGNTPVVGFNEAEYRKLLSLWIWR